MEDRVRTLEEKFTKLDTTINTSVKWIGVVAALLAGWLGFNTFFQIPRAIEATNTSTVQQKITDLLNSAEEDSEAIAVIRSDHNNLIPIQMYQCPNQPIKFETSAWVSFGCVGQISSKNICTSYAWQKDKDLVWKDTACTPITLYKQQ